MTSKVLEHKKLLRLKRKARVKAKIKGCEAKPRVSVFRSNKYFYAQAIDDTKGHTLASIDSRAEKLGNTKEDSHKLGEKFGRVTKVVKGGRRFRFNALVVIGNRNGLVGFGLGKAKEVPDAIKKAIDDAFKNVIKINIKGTTIAHDIEYKYNASRILLKPASAGTGVIAGGSARPVIELAGIKDILTKSLGSNNPYNVVRATFDALAKIKG